MYLNTFSPINTVLKHSSASKITKPKVVSVRILVLSVLLTLALSVAFHHGYDLWKAKRFVKGESLFLRSDIQQNAQNIEFVRQEAEAQLHALTARVAELQARILRVDALGERIVALESLDPEEFDFGSPPAMGGPEVVDFQASVSRPDFLNALDQLAADLETREQQLALLEKLLLDRQYDGHNLLSGKPVRKGWMTSRFGRRLDPFTGRSSQHEGVDFSGRVGSEIISVGDGLVTWAGDRFGYGMMVEINHGRGYTTRYGHASQIEVSVGDIVKKGQLIARMGNTGRSTGTHVHFEVRHNGVALDPARVLFKKG